MKLGFGNQPHMSDDPRGRRADMVRQRRTQGTRDRASEASRRIMNPSAARPVVVRGIGGVGPRTATPIYKETATYNPRRQLYLSMDSNGSELRLPAIPLRNPGWRIISGIIVLLALIGLYSMFNSSYFMVDSVSVQGLKRIQPADVDSIVHLQNLSIVEVQPEVVEKEIASSFPELADVRVSVELPNYVTIAASERQPALAWQQGEKTLWVDTEGNVFPARGQADVLVTVKTDDSLPLAPLTKEMLTQAALTADAAQSSSSSSTPALGIPATSSAADPALSGRKADLRLLNAALQLQKKLPKDTQIIYDKLNGLGWNDPGGWQVFIGKDLGDFNGKFAAYQAILKNLQDEGIKVLQINVEYPNAPFYHAAEEKKPEE